jgi:hypothetical protein
MGSGLQLREENGKIGFGSNIDHSFIVGWVEPAGDGLAFSAGGPTYFQAILVLSAKPNKMAW